MESWTRFVLTEVTGQMTGPDDELRISESSISMQIYNQNLISIDMFDFVFGSKGKAYCLELDGELISFCGYFELSEDAFLIISYITEKKYRGMGYGSRCFKAVMDECKGKRLLINSGYG